jgi:anaerobic nitric oxide reductase transcription regulator
LLRASLRAAAGRRGEPVAIDAAHLGIAPPAVAALVPSDPIAAPLPAATSLRQATDDFQRRLIADALRAAGGNWSTAARALGLDRANLRRLATRLGVG